MKNACPRILITGGNGFVGRHLLDRLRTEGMDAVGTVRNGIGGGLIAGPILGEKADWRSVLRGRNTVVHTAARVHVMKEHHSDPLTAFRQVNVLGTVALAKQAADAGVRRFIFISSIKANGEASPPGKPFSADDEPAPVDPYGISKVEAETSLLALARETGMEVVIIRPPLVYGPGVKANFLSMMRWLAWGLPLPLGAIQHNRRSIVAIDNLVDLIVRCLNHPAAANQVFLAGDGEDLSTTDLLRRLAAAMGLRAHLISVPVKWLEFGAATLGKQAMLQRLCGNLQVDIAKTRELLEWTPPIGVDEGLRRAGQEFLRASCAYG